MEKSLIISNNRGVSVREWQSVRETVARVGLKARPGRLDCLPVTLPRRGLDSRMNDATVSGAFTLQSLLPKIPSKNDKVKL